MRGDETRVVDAFCAYLTAHGWHDVHREVHFCDVVATRDGQTLYAEPKGKTADTSTDTDTLYGQFLRRKMPTTGPDARFAVVVPTSSVTAALRVHAQVRQLLRIDVYAVDDDSTVRLVEG